MTIHTCLVRGCQGKLRYQTKQQAKRAARRVVSSTGGGEMQAYRCHCCRAIHIGHADPTRKP
jgi:hypothetical protein